MCERFKPADFPQPMTFDIIHATEPGPYAAELKAQKEQEEKQATEEEHPASIRKDPNSIDDGTFDLLPVPREPFDKVLLKEVLSVVKNPYLACKWDNFLNDHIKDPWIKVDVFRNQTLNPQIPRRLSLTGKLYDHQLREAPVPSQPNPRGIAKNIACSRRRK